MIKNFAILTPDIDTRDRVLDFLEDLGHYGIAPRRNPKSTLFSLVVYNQTLWVGGWSGRWEPTFNWDSPPLELFDWSNRDRTLRPKY